RPRRRAMAKRRRRRDPHHQRQGGDPDPHTTPNAHLSNRVFLPSARRLACPDHTETRKSSTRPGCTTAGTDGSGALPRLELPWLARGRRRVLVVLEAVAHDRLPRRADLVEAADGTPVRRAADDLRLVTRLADDLQHPLRKRV